MHPLISFVWFSGFRSFSSPREAPASQVVLGDGDDDDTPALALDDGYVGIMSASTLKRFMDNSDGVDVGRFAGVAFQQQQQQRMF